MYRAGGGADRQTGKAYVDHLSEEEIRDYRGSLGEPGRPVALSGSHGRRKTWPFSARCGPGDLPDGQLRAQGQDRSRRRQYEDARPAAVPDPPRPPSPHRRRLAHLPDVRLGPPHLRRHRRRDPLALHPGVRKQPGALRLGYRHTRASPNATVSAGPTSTSSPVSTSTTPS